jgi:hypothetical protein
MNLNVNSAIREEYIKMVLMFAENVNIFHMKSVRIKKKKF